jgi:hypothetical protein
MPYSGGELAYLRGQSDENVRYTCHEFAGFANVEGLQKIQRLHLNISWHYSSPNKKRCASHLKVKGKAVPLLN